jgi:uncharacterized protein DUF4255
MSNPLAIATVTAALRNLLTQGITADPELGDATVTTQPVDRARVNGNNANQVNVFLYHTLPSAAWRNMDLPGRVMPGESGLPTLGVNLYYLITAYGRDNDAQRPFSHHLMGRAMSILYDHPLLSSDEIKAALPNNDLWLQIERVRFTLQPISLDEISKLWTGFQTQYRLSVAYEASVVLIESTRPVRTPVPVLTRGPADSGVVAQADLIPPFPAIAEVLPPNQQPSAVLGDTVTIHGHHLDGTQVAVQLTSRRLAAPLKVAVLPGGTEAQVTFQIPNDPVNVPAGFYTVSVIVSRKGEADRITNEMPVTLSPKITSAMPMKVKRVKGDVTLNLTCAPEVRPSQRAALLLGSQEVAAAAHPNQGAQLTFVVHSAVPGEYLTRLRVDGVDTLLVDRSVTPPVFDASQKVKIS